MTRIQFAELLWRAGYASEQGSINDSHFLGDHANVIAVTLEEEPADQFRCACHSRSEALPQWDAHDEVNWRTFVRIDYGECEALEFTRMRQADHLFALRRGENGRLQRIRIEHNRP